MSIYWLELIRNIQYRISKVSLVSQSSLVTYAQVKSTDICVLYFRMFYIKIVTKWHSNNDERQNATRHLFASGAHMTIGHVLMSHYAIKCDRL